jgi:hypothetical protein
MAHRSWLLVTYKVPPEPSKNRVGFWRKLKSMGGVYLQSGVCLLPKTDENGRHLKILENDISKAGGEAVILETIALDRLQEDKVIGRFKADREEEYREFLDKCGDFDAEMAKETKAKHFTYAELEENEVDLKKLQHWLEKIKRLDFYEAKSRSECEKRLRGCEALLEAYARCVFEAHDENR